MITNRVQGTWVGEFASMCLIQGRAYFMLPTGLYQAAAEQISFELYQEKGDLGWVDCCFTPHLAWSSTLNFFCLNCAGTFSPTFFVGDDLDSQQTFEDHFVGEDMPELDSVILASEVLELLRATREILRGTNV